MLRTGGSNPRIALFVNHKSAVSDPVVTGVIMKDWLILNCGAGGLLRRYTILSVVLTVGTFVAANGIISLVQQAIPDQTTRLSAHQATQEAPRLYTLTRSVLDDQITTGSIQKVEPCGKAEKSR
jgi:hypothetical protein